MHFKSDFIEFSDTHIHLVQSVIDSYHLIQRQMLEESDNVRGLALTRKVFADYNQRFDRRVINSIVGMTEIWMNIDISKKSVLSYLLDKRTEFADNATAYLHACALVGQNMEERLYPGMSIEQTHRDLGKVLVETFDDRESVSHWFSLHDMVTRYPLSLFREVCCAQRNGTLSSKIPKLQHVYDPQMLSLLDYEKDLARKVFISNLFDVPFDPSQN